MLKNNLLRETYLAAADRVIPEGAVRINVTYVARSPLAPAWSMITKWKAHQVKWSEFENAYLRRIKTRPEALRAIDEIVSLLRAGRIVYLICYEKRFPCHRYILKRHIERILGLRQNPPLDAFFR